MSGGGRLLLHPRTSEKARSSLSALAANLGLSLGLQDGAEQSQGSFRSHLYFATRGESAVLGRHVAHFPSVSSTMDVSAQLLNSDSPEAWELVVVGDVQTAGRGRAANLWSSPLGCLCFSFPLRLHLSSPLGQSPAFPQHLLAAAVAASMRRLRPGLQVSIKWPNDLYYKREAKLGGILVKSSLLGEQLRLNLGCGLNVANEEPTLCLNNLLKSGGWEPLSQEEVLAAVLADFEDLLRLWDQGKKEQVLQTYHSLWLHSGEEVKLGEGDGGEAVRILGLDEDGYLLAESLSEPRRTFSLHPDGNSFDMMQGLIKAKK